MKYKAAMFDFDGTITAKGVSIPSQKMINTLVDLAQKMPIAFCTGRQVESFKKHGLENFLKKIDEKKKNIFLENLFLMSENGSVGYRFDTKINDFKEIYKVAWPEKIVSREQYRKDLEKLIDGRGEVLYQAHKVVVVVHTNIHDNLEIEEVYELSKEVYGLICEYLKNINKDYAEYFHIGNSGIGVLTIPANGDKDNGIKEFAKYLITERGIEFEKDLRNILLVGDRPQKGGNDHYFLRGEWGSSYTVGTFIDGGEWPKGVFDEDGKRLMNDEGTIYLINQINLP